MSHARPDSRRIKAGGKLIGNHGNGSLNDHDWEARETRIREVDAMKYVASEIADLENKEPIRMEVLEERKFPTTLDWSSSDGDTIVIGANGKFRVKI